MQSKWQMRRNTAKPTMWRPPSLIRVFAVRMKKVWVLSYPLSAQLRLWSDWADAQADLSLRWRTLILLVLWCRGSNSVDLEEQSDLSLHCFYPDLSVLKPRIITVMMYISDRDSGARKSLGMAGRKLASSSQRRFEVRKSSLMHLILSA